MFSIHLHNIRVFSELVVIEHYDVTMSCHFTLHKYRGLYLNLRHYLSLLRISLEKLKLDILTRDTKKDEIIYAVALQKLDNIYRM